jgi:hypothetical protein
MTTTPVVLAVLASAAGDAPALSALYRQARRYDRATFRFSPPSEVRRRAVEDAVSELAEAAVNGSCERQRQAAADTGMELTAARDAAGPLWVLREPDGRREGAGLYAFRPGGVPVCIQAPHTFFDAGTGELALAVFARLRAACLAVNTVHRRTPAASGQGEPADVAHASATLFHAVSRAILLRARWPLVQLHGFAARPEVAAGVAAVVSDGTRRVRNQGPAARLRGALARRMAAPALLFPADVQVLGATGNVQGREARRAGVAFLHIELAETVRRQPAASAVAPLADAIAEALHLP